jgi:hypothetical protein
MGPILTMTFPLPTVHPVLAIQSFCLLSAILGLNELWLPHCLVPTCPCSPFCTGQCSYTDFCSYHQPLANVSPGLGHSTALSRLNMPLLELLLRLPGIQVSVLMSLSWEGLSDPQTRSCPCDQ